MPDGNLLTTIVEAMIEIGTPPCASCEFARTDCRGWRACGSFAQWTETGEATGDRTPTLEQYAALYPGVVPASVLHRYWRKGSGRLSGAAQRGEAQAMTRAEARRRHRERLKLVWQVDPARREAYLARKRAAQMRRERDRGRQPLTPERASARAKLIWQKRRAKTAEPMTREELIATMTRLQLTAEALASELDISTHCVHAWLRPSGRMVSGRAATWLRTRPTGWRPKAAIAHRPGYMGPVEFREALVVTGISIEEVAAKAQLSVERAKTWRCRSDSGPPKRVVAWLRALVAIRQEAAATRIVGRPRGRDRRRPSEEGGADRRGTVSTTPAPEPLRGSHPATGDVVLVTPPLDPRPPALA